MFETKERVNNRPADLAKKYRPRNDLVLFRRFRRDETESGIALPQKAKEASRLVVVAVGPKVEGLKAGDEFLLMAVDAVVAEVLGEKDLYFTREANAVVVVASENAG